MSRRTTDDGGDPQKSLEAAFRKLPKRTREMLYELGEIREHQQLARSPAAKRMKIVKKYGPDLVREAIPIQKRKRGRPRKPPGFVSSKLMDEQDYAQWIDEAADEYRLRQPRCKAPVKRAILDLLEMQLGEDGLAKLTESQLSRKIKTLKRYACDGRKILDWQRETARAFHRPLQPKST